MVGPEENRRMCGLSKGAAVTYLQLSVAPQEMHLVLLDLPIFKEKPEICFYVMPPDLKTLGNMCYL